MRFVEYLTEMTDNYGIIVTVERSSGNFEDMSLYDIDSRKIHYSKDHAQDLFDSFVNMIKQEENWHQVNAFLKRESNTATVMGAEYDDDENFTNILYGPFSTIQLGHLGTAFEEEFGDHEEDDDWDTDEFKRAEFDRTEAKAINRGY